MSVFVAADHHFSHKNVIRFDGRPFSNVEEMNLALVERHNSVVKPDDTVYFLGDVSFDKKLAADQVTMLNGKKILLAGNHDDLKNSAFIDAFDEVHKYLRRRLFGKDVIFFHYPIYDWDKKFHGSFHLHGHVHGKPTGIGGRISDVWLGNNDYFPINLEFLLNHLESL